jgi:hypothetical protein
MRRETLATALLGGMGGQALDVAWQFLLFPAVGINAAVVHLLQSGTWSALVTAGSAPISGGTPKSRKELS